ncbi:MAG TPA: hypothetical protein VJJ23_06845 [Candidatus Nanoarchaeia archaeon]|nr:hypothetical protein [Candidatus Nanoarchaeia archaeon]
MPNNQENRGAAYAFFDCDASKEQIERAMPNVRYDARTPENLQLLLQEGVSGLRIDAKLTDLIECEKDYRIMSSERMGQETGFSALLTHGEEIRPLYRMKYAMVASYDGHSNEDTANELGDIVNDIHRKFGNDQDVFRGAVVYEKDGEYQFKE